MKLIILDRDGVINEDSEDYIKSPEEWRPISGSLEAIALLNQKGYIVSVATNQSGLARGYYSLDVLNLIHQKMHDSVKAVGGKIDSVFFCPHGPADNCECRKPKPGLLLQIAKHYKISLDNVSFVGDSFRDVQAALDAEAKPVLVRTGKGESAYQQNRDALNTVAVYSNLLDFAKNL